jgi:signal transduction histidine kinase
LIEENTFLKQSVDEVNSMNRRLTLQNNQYKEITEIYDQQINEMEEQQVFENVFLVKVEKFLQNAVFSATMLNNLINDLLDLAKFEAGTFKFHDEYFDFIEVIENAFETLRYQADKKEIQLHYKLVDERENSRFIIHR